MYEKQCNGCGARYQITRHPVPMRDSDSISCQECGTELLSWNGGVVHYAELISRPSPASDSFDHTDDDPMVNT